MNPNRLDIDLSNAANQYLGAPVNFNPWIPSLYVIYYQQNQKSWSQEISFENTSREDLNWQVGVFYNQDDHRWRCHKICWRP